MSSLRSMTGFGRAEAGDGELRIVTEIKSVNHRFLDISIKMPRTLNPLDGRIRRFLKEHLERGKLDVYISFEDYTESARKLIYNSGLAGEYVSLLNKMSEEFGIRNDIGTLSLSKFPDVIITEDRVYDVDTTWESIRPVLEESVRNLVADREREGEHLREDLLIKLDGMEKDVRTIEDMSPVILENYRNKLYNKICETLGDVLIQADDVRIITETAIYADKVCTDEETVRLLSHISTARERLTGGGACGRELDFIAQEMNREANTILSKAGDLAKADAAISLKTVIEKIREQVQNIE